MQYSQRVVHTDTQDMIATVAGPLDVGAVAPWRATHSVPIEDDEKGRVTVSRTISSGTLDCKEIVFSVDHDATKNAPPSSAFYVASVCRDGDKWKWASAEPATPNAGARCNERCASVLHARVAAVLPTGGCAAEQRCA